MLLFKVLVVFFTLSGALSKKALGPKNLLQNEIKKMGQIACKKTSINYLRRLHVEGPISKLKLCMLKILDSKDSGNALLWTMLGEVFTMEKATSKANICFKESARIMGKVSKYIPQWRFIGPFTIGKIEADGDPLEDWEGAKNASKYRWSDKVVYYSELVPNGEVRWKTVNVERDDESVYIAPAIDWNELVMSLQSMGITEWQGWVFGDFIVNEDCTLLFQGLGVSTLYIDDVMLVGDLYRRDQYWYPVSLRRGIHTVQIRLRAKGPASFNVNFKLEKQIAKILHPPFLPDLVDGKLFSRYIPVPVSNGHASQWLKLVKVSLTDGEDRKRFSVNVHKVERSFAIAPGQTKYVVLQVESRDQKLSKKHASSKCKDVFLSIKLSFVGSTKDQSLEVKLRCRKHQESFLFTFIDHDGSLQHAAAIAPLKPCPSGTCPVLLTLHGTTVPPQNQADSYKRMVNGKFVFGVEHLWVLAPTRHGAHNWEGPGEMTALTALSRLAALTQEFPWLETKATDQLMVVAGHSMGGHGAWQISTHNPDKTLALISAAGWIRKEDYGDSNLFFRHDVSTSHVDPQVKSLMEATIAENDADKHVSNLHGIPVLIRVGANDKTVHPYYSRRMYRLLRQQRSNVTYEELPTKEHWWWDTYTTNDGGVTNDPVIRDFAIRHAKHAGEEQQSCDSDGCREKRSNINKYKEQSLLAHDRNMAGDGIFTLTVYNPASFTGLRGIRVLRQEVPFHRSTVKITLSPGTAVLRTRNVRRMSLNEPAISPVHWTQRSLIIDQMKISLKKWFANQNSSLSNGPELCKEQNKWIICEEPMSRPLTQMGPARRVAEQPFLIVSGTGGKVVSPRVLLQFSVYIANQFHLTSEAIAPIVSDTELSDETAKHYNLIVIGGPADNIWASKLAGRNLEFLENDRDGYSLSISCCRYNDSRTGALFLTQHGPSHLALLLGGNSEEGLRDVIHLATPTIPPMARSPFSNLVPDYVITGPRFGARGPGGYLCAGFWGNQDSWSHEGALSSCFCDYC